MIKKIPGEIWKQMQFSGHKQLRKKYAVSNTGRAASYTKDIASDGKLLNGSLTSGYRTLNLHVENGNGTIYIHREVAKLFCKKKSPKYKFVIHVNHKKSDNTAKNLKWATLEQMISHQQQSPAKIAYKEKQANKTTGLKLTAAQVKKIKTVLQNPQRKITIRQLAKNYDISEMTIYRIKSGENWSRI